jgi:hypothetical protein
VAKIPSKNTKIDPRFIAPKYTKKKQALQKRPQKMPQGNFCQVWGFFGIFLY